MVFDLARVGKGVEKMESKVPERLFFPLSNLDWFVANAGCYLLLFICAKRKLSWLCREESDYWLMVLALG